MNVLEGEIGSLQAELASLQKQKVDNLDPKSKSKLYEWQTSDGDKPGESAAQYSVVQLLLVFIIFMGIGSYLVK